MNINKTSKLYNQRFLDYGNDIKTVGWGSKKDQFLRFDVLFTGTNPVGKSILDVGCGLGDLINYLDKKTNGNYNYTGIDIAEKLIFEAKKNHSSKNRNFYNSDIFSIQSNYDIVIMSGAFSHKSDGIEDYTSNALKKMFDISNELVSANFLTKYVDYELEKNQHYFPEDIYKQSKKYCNKINLISDYPLYEFTIQLKK